MDIIKRILRNSKWVLNQRGLAPWVLPAAISGGSALLKHFGDKKKKTEGVQWHVDPWTQKLRDMYQPMAQPSFYDIPKTGVESATETGLMGRLRRGVSDIKPALGPEAAKPYYEAEKTRMGERFGEEEAYMKDILQKEGVLTSTPGMKAMIDLKRKQGLDLDVFSKKLMYEDVSRDIDATRMAEEIIANTMSQGMMFGGQQRQNLQWPYMMATQALGGMQGLGSMGYMPEEEKGLMSELGGAGMDIGKMMLMMNMLKK